jgi:hypothetical protein
LLLLCCVVAVWYVSVRAGERTRAPAAPGLVHRQTQVRRGPPGFVPRDHRPLPRPQNPAGSAWRIVKVPTTRRSSWRRRRRRREVVKPRPKSCPDLGGDLPTCWRSLRAHLASLAHLAHRGRPERRPLLGSCAGNPSPGPKGGAAGIRTPDLRRARAALSQLSYGPEPASRRTDRHGWARLDSNQGPRPYQGRALTS